jgi:hypothetical protein
MLTRPRVGTPAGLSILFVLLAAVPLAALGWLGSRLLAQEGELERQQRRELLENSTALLAHEIDRSLSRWEELDLSVVWRNPHARASRPAKS